jgi:serine O-acetyltransferase
MSEAVTKLDTHDPVWRDIRQAAITLTAEEPVLGSLVHASVLNQPRFEDALAYILAQRLGTEEAPAMLLRQTFDALVAAKPDIGAAARADLAAVYDRDPACKSPLEALLFRQLLDAAQVRLPAKIVPQVSRVATKAKLPGRRK